MSIQLVLPALFMIGLTFLVLIRIMQTRFPEMIKNKIHPQSVATRKEMSALVNDCRASDNLMNLFELPIIFYFLTLVALIFKIDSVLLITLMWLFVILRYAHSFIHCTYNKVRHRFYAFMSSSFVLLLIFITTVFKIIT